MQAVRRLRTVARLPSVRLLRRMGRGMHRLQRPDRYLRVDLRTLYATVTQHRLDPSDIRAVLQHLGRHRMPEQVATALHDPHRSQVRHNSHAHTTGRQPSSGYFSFLRNPVGTFLWGRLFQAHVFHQYPYQL